MWCDTDEDETLGDRMVTIFATLGYVPESVLPSLRKAGVDELVVFASTKEKKVETAVKKVKEHCQKADIPFRRVRVKAPYDLERVAGDIRDTLERYKGKDIIFNITGGTKVMACAALIVCFLRGIPTEYAQERTMDIITLPLMKIDPKGQLTRRQREIVDYLLGQKEHMATTAQLRKALKLKKSTLSTHLTNMRKRGLITVESDPSYGRSRLVKVIPSLRILMMG
jgi:CRISPR locus-related DNA-binding protein